MLETAVPTSNEMQHPERLKHKTQWQPFEPGQGCHKTFENKFHNFSRTSDRISGFVSWDSDNILHKIHSPPILEHRQIRDLILIVTYKYNFHFSGTSNFFLFSPDFSRVSMITAFSTTLTNFPYNN